MQVAAFILKGLVGMTVLSTLLQVLNLCVLKYTSDHFLISCSYEKNIYMQFFSEDFRKVGAK